MNWEVVGQIVVAGIALITAVFGAFKLLLKDNFAKAKEVETLKAKNTTDAMAQLEKNLNGQQTRLKEFEAKLQFAVDAFKKAEETYKKAMDNQVKMIQMLKSYIQKTEQRLEKAEGSIIQLGEDLIMVKGGK